MTNAGRRKSTDFRKVMLELTIELLSFEDHFAALLRLRFRALTRYQGASVQRLEEPGAEAKCTLR